MNSSTVIKFLRGRSLELLMGITFFLLLYRWDLGWFNTHMSRDFYRALQWSNLNFESWLGPEMGDEFKRLPGPAYYLFLAPFMKFGSLLPALIAKTTLTIGCVYFLAREIRSRFPQLITSFALLFLVTPFFIFTGRNFWNPSLVVALNCIQFFFLLKFEETKSKKWQWASLVLAVLALQVHFSTILIFISFNLTVFISSHFERRLKLIQGAMVTLFSLFLGVWYYANYVPEFDRQITNYVGFNGYFINRVIDLNSFVSLYIHNLGDYNLFSLFIRSLNELGLFDQGFNLFVIGVLSWSLLTAFVAGIVLCFRKFKVEKKSVYLFVAIHAIVFFVSILMIRNKPKVPYRYGLALFPVQFFLISVVFHELILKWPRLKVFIKYILPSFIVSYYMFFNLKMLQAQELTGRTHNTLDDNLELTIGNKLRIYDLVQGDLNVDPFSQLHGRTVNRFRLKEFDWLHRHSYFSLFRIARDGYPAFNPALADLNPVPGYFVQLKNLDELTESSDDNLKIAKLNVDRLPQNLQIVYFDVENNILKTRTWNNTSLVMPLNFLDELVAKIDRIELRFKVSSPNGEYLNILMNSNERFSWAYPPDFIFQSLFIEKVEAHHERFYIGNFLVQNQYVYKLPAGTNLDVVLNLKANVHYTNASRVDIFLTDQIPSREELFPR